MNLKVKKIIALVLISFSLALPWIEFTYFVPSVPAVALNGIELLLRAFRQMSFFFSDNRYAIYSAITLQPVSVTVLLLCLLLSILQLGGIFTGNNRIMMTLLGIGVVAHTVNLLYWFSLLHMEIKSGTWVALLTYLITIFTGRKRYKSTLSEPSPEPSIDIN
jgi:hypothetical protein